MRLGSRKSLQALATGGSTTLEALADVPFSRCSLLHQQPQLHLQPLQSLQSAAAWLLQIASPISTSAHSTYKFDTHVKKPVPKARLLNQTNYKAWRLTDYDVKLGEQMILRSQQKGQSGRSLLDNMPRPPPAASASPEPPPDLDAMDLAARASARQAAALDLQRQASMMLISAGDVMEMKYLLQELGQGLNAFCIVAAISRLPKLSKVKLSVGMGNPARFAGQILDKLLPRLEEQIARSAVTQDQIAMVLAALGEMGYHPYQRLQEQLTDSLQYGIGRSTHSTGSSSSSGRSSSGSSSGSSSDGGTLSGTSGPMASMEARHVASAMLGVAKLHVEDEQLWQALEAAATQRLDGLPPVTVATVARALAVAKRAQSPLWEMLGHQVLEHMFEYSHELLSNVLHAFALQKVPHEPLFEGVWEVIAPLLEPGPSFAPRLPPQAHANFVTAYSSASSDPDLTTARMELLCQAARDNLLAFDCRQVEQLAAGMVQANFTQDAVLIKLLGDLVRVRGSAQFGMKRIGHMLHILARLQYDSSSETWRQLAVSTARMVPHMQLEQVSWVVGAYARVQRNAREEGSEEGPEAVALAAAPVVHAAAQKLNSMLDFGLPAVGTRSIKNTEEQQGGVGGLLKDDGSAEGTHAGNSLVTQQQQPLARQVCAAALADPQAVGVLPELSDVLLMVLRQRHK